MQELVYSLDLSVNTKAVYTFDHQRLLQVKTLLLWVGKTFETTPYRKNILDVMRDNLSCTVDQTNSECVTQNATFKRDNLTTCME